MKKPHLAALAALFFAMTLFVGCASKPIPLKPDPRALVMNEFAAITPPQNILSAATPYTPIGEIVTAYKTNPLNAEEKFTDNWVKIRGPLITGPFEVMYSGTKSYVVTLGKKDKDAVLLCSFIGEDKLEGMKQLENGKEVCIAGIVRSTPKGLMLMPSVLIQDAEK